jgi:purine-cytosine permease-like protein
VILLVAAVQLSIPALGHATIKVVQKILAWVFALFFLIVTVMIAGKARFSGGQ